MGNIKKIKKSYARPLKPWDMSRMEEEKVIDQKYGLKNKREIWRAQAIIRTFRRNARHILSLPSEEAVKRKADLINKLAHIGLIESSATLDDVLGLKTEDILNRRLQTIIFKKGLAHTVKQARQIIVHGHVIVNGRVNNAPSTIIPADIENTINVNPKFKVVEKVEKAPKAAPTPDVQPAKKEAAA